MIILSFYIRSVEFVISIRFAFSILIHTKELNCARRYLFYFETFQQKRYLVTVLVPIGVGIVGAALIVCTILTLRKVARQRSLQVPFDDAEVERSITPSVSSVSTFFCNQ